MRAMLAVCFIASACAFHVPVAATSRNRSVMLAAAKAAPPSLFVQLKEASRAAVSTGVAAFSSRALPVKVALAALALAFALVLIEIKKRLELIRAGDDCMSGDDDACELYDNSVEKTPIWKLRMAYNKLVQTNMLASKLAGPPPKGFEWGKII